MSKSPTTTDTKDIKTLARLMVDHDLTEIDIQQKDGSRVTLKRQPFLSPLSSSASFASPLSAPVASVAPATSPIAPSSAAAAGSSSPATSADEEAGLSRITSPMVGTFYLSSSPQAKPLVNVGDRIKADTTVCIIEAMKVFNEIKAETSGTVVKVLVASGKTVEFGQPLFLIQPD